MFKNRIRKWLEVPEKVESPEISKEIRDTMSKLQSELDFWKGWFRSRTPTKKCTKCKQEIDLWPFNATVAYYIKGNRVTHQTCPETISNGI